MAISWTAKKQLFVFFIVCAVIIIAVLLFLLSLGNPTCFDGRRNQGEKGIDCGGPCEPCVGEVKNLIIHWSKIFKLKNGNYEAAALIDNPNLFAGLPSLKYKFHIYDEKNVLIAIKSGKTFINPDERFLIFETSIEVGERIPKHAFLEFEGRPEWKRIEKEKPQIVVSKKQFFNSEPFPKLIIGINNKSLFSAENIFLAAVLYGKDQNAKAVSVSKIDYIGGGSSKEAVFTWPEVFLEEPASSEIFIRVSLID